MNLADISTREDHPHIGGVVSAISAKTCAVPPFVLVPDYLVVNGQFRSGQNAGFLGKRYDPLVPGGDPSRDDFRPLDLGLGETVEAAQLRQRRELLAGLNSRTTTSKIADPVSEMDSYRDKAFALLETDRTRRTFDVGAEALAVRERYGKDFFGQSVLLGRRLLEAGARLVHVNCMSSIFGGDKNWDTHKDNFNLLSQILLPRTDRAIAALLADLSASGLLDETLVVVTGEFGRTPKINPQAGRDHWPHVFSVLLAGQGFQGVARSEAPISTAPRPPACRFIPQSWRRRSSTPSESIQQGNYNFLEADPGRFQTPALWSACGLRRPRLF